MCFAAVKGVSAIIGPLVAAALHPKKLAGTVLTAGRGGWGGYGFTGSFSFRTFYFLGFYNCIPHGPVLGRNRYHRVRGECHGCYRSYGRNFGGYQAAFRNSTTRSQLALHYAHTE